MSSSLKPPPPREGVFNALSLLAFATFVMFVGSRHQPWFDEAQAWLIARDNSPWSLMATGVRYEGTPALWHLLLWSAERLALPYEGLFIISGGLGLCGAYVVVTKSPFPRWLRLGLIFSYFFIYQYSIIARSYALDLVFVPLLAWLFKGRLTRPLLYAATLGLVANTNAHSFVLSNVLALELAWSGRKATLALNGRLISALALYGIFALAAVFQAFPPDDINFVIRKPGEYPLLRALQLAAEAFIERWDVFASSPPTVPSRLAGAVISIGVVLPALILFAKAKRLILALALMGVLVGFSAVKYGNAWHAGIIFLAFVFCLWISWSNREELPIWQQRWLSGGLVLLLSVQIWCALSAASREVRAVYSPARAVAAYLKPGIQSGAAAKIGVAGFKAFAVQPYFAGNIFANYQSGAPRPAYYLWRRSQSPIPGVNEAKWRTTAAAGYDRLLLSSFNLMGFNGRARFTKDALEQGYCEAARFRGQMFWKTYVLESDDMMVFDRCPAQSKPLRAP